MTGSQHGPATAHGSDNTATADAATAEFISRHADADVRQLALQAAHYKDVDMGFALDQIAGRQTARHKLPSWALTEGLHYPPRLAMEQCSSEATARYKAQLVSRIAPAATTLVDLTGGFGVDFSFMAKGMQRAVYVERQEPLCAVAHHNLRLLALPQAEVACTDAACYLSQMAEPADIIYMDPARRDTHGQRTYALADCTPDVLQLRDELLRKARWVVVKLSPMLDWHKAVADLGVTAVSEVHIVAVGNECKELLVVMKGSGILAKRDMAALEDRLAVHGDMAVHCVDLMPDGTCRNFAYNTSPSTKNHPPSTKIHPPSTNSPHYLYEPNAAIMKAGCYDEVASHYGVTQIAPNSHLFVAGEAVSDFPGRRFELTAVTSLNKHELRRTLQGLTQANISVRNFPATVADLRRRLKLGEGGSTYIFATTLDTGDRVLLLCRKV